MRFRALIAAAMLPCVGGCASVFEGTHEDISVVTNPVGATCTFEREGKPIGSVVNTPGTLTVRKSKYDITIKCNKSGYQEAAYINHSGTTATIAANVAVDLILTAGISSIVDIRGWRRQQVRQGRQRHALPAVDGAGTIPIRPKGFPFRELWPD